MYFNFLMDDEIIHQKNNKSYEAPLGAKNDLAIFCNSPLVRYKKHQVLAFSETNCYSILLVNLHANQFRSGCTGVTKYTISQIGIVYYWINS